MLHQWGKYPYGCASLCVHPGSGMHSQSKISTSLANTNSILSIRIGQSTCQRDDMGLRASHDNQIVGARANHILMKMKM